MNPKLEPLNSTRRQPTERPNAVHRGCCACSALFLRSLTVLGVKNPFCEPGSMAVSSAFKRYLAAKKIIFDARPLLRDHFASHHFALSRNSKQQTAAASRTCRAEAFRQGGHLGHFSLFFKTVRLGCNHLRRKSWDTVPTPTSFSGKPKQKMKPEIVPIFAPFLPTSNERNEQIRFWSLCIFHSALCI